MAIVKEKPDWFKLDPSKFLSDVLVDSMNAAEFGATVRLILRQWLDGWIPDDLMMLSRLCRMTLSEMESAWPMVSRFFPEIEPGKRANRFMWCERAMVMAEFERKRDAGKEAANRQWDAKKAATRSKKEALPQESDSSPVDGRRVTQGSPKGHPMQDIDIDIDKEQVLSTLAPSAKKPALVAGSQPAGTLPLVDGTDFTITKAQVAEWKDAFPAVDVLQQLREMKVWTQAHKDRRKTRRGIVKFVVAWLSREQDKGPTQGQNGAPANGTNQLSPTKQRANANRAALAEALVRRGIDPSCLDRGSNAPALPEPRPDGQPGGVLVGFRATGPEILPPESHSSPGGTQAHTGAELLSAAR